MKISEYPNQDVNVSDNIISVDEYYSLFTFQPKPYGLDSFFCNG